MRGAVLCNALCTSNTPHRNKNNFLTETATNVVRVVARCETTDGGKWVGLVSDLALRSHSRRIAHRLVGPIGRGGGCATEEWTECIAIHRIVLIPYRRGLPGSSLLDLVLPLPVRCMLDPACSSCLLRRCCLRARPLHHGRLPGARVAALRAARGCRDALEHPSLQALPACGAIGALPVDGDARVRRGTETGPF
jgi:hypothetical protein